MPHDPNVPDWALRHRHAEAKAAPADVAPPTPAVPSGRLLRIPDAAARLAVSPRTVRRMIASGRLPAVRLGRVVRLREEDLAALLASSVIGGVND